MPCGFLWLSEGLHALLVPVSFGPFRNRVSLSGWCRLAKGPYLGGLVCMAVPGHCTRPFALNLWEVSGCPAYRVKVSSHIHPEVGESGSASSLPICTSCWCPQAAAAAVGKEQHRLWDRHPQVLAVRRMGENILTSHYCHLTLH